jgi:hypothetical protein
MIGLIHNGEATTDEMILAKGWPEDCQRDPLQRHYPGTDEHFRLERAMPASLGGCGFRGPQMIAVRVEAAVYS